MHTQCVEEGGGAGRARETSNGLAEKASLKEERAILLSHVIDCESESLLVSPEQELIQR